MPTTTANKLTEARVRALEPRKTAYKASDGLGLYLLLTPTGSKLWRLKYRLGGVERTFAIGAWPEVSLREAREARDKARELVRKGIDPVAERREARKPVTPALTVEALVRDWHAQQTRRQTEAHRAQILRTLEAHVLPTVGHLEAADLAPAVALDVIRTVERKGRIETARRCRMWASMAFRYGMASGLVQSDPWAAITGALAPRPKVQHFASMTLADLRALMRSLDAYGGERVTALAIKFTALTWARTQETIGARWCEIDFDAALWTVPAERMKKRREHVVPLSASAVGVLRELWPLTGAFDLLFPSSRDSGKSISTNTMLYALYRLGHHSRATVHGFRSLASTTANESGRFRSDVIEMALAHVEENKVRAAYNRAAYLAERRELMEWWAEQVRPLEPDACG